MKPVFSLPLFSQTDIKIKYFQVLSGFDDISLTKCCCFLTVLSSPPGRSSVPDWTSASYSYNKQRLYPALPGRTFVCVKSYTPQSEAELMIKKGQFVEGGWTYDLLSLSLLLNGFKKRLALF